MTLVVPSGWSAPSTTGSAAGFTTASTGTVAVSAQTITVSGVTVSAGNIHHRLRQHGQLRTGRHRSLDLGAQTWQAQEKSTSGGTLTNLASSPSSRSRLPTAGNPRRRRPRLWSVLDRQYDHLHLHRGHWWDE